MSERTSYPNLSTYEATLPDKVSIIVNNIMQGKINCIVDAVILESAGSPTIIQDPRISAMSYVAVMERPGPPGPPTVRSGAIRDGEIELTWTGSGWGEVALRILVLS